MGSIAAAEVANDVIKTVRNGKIPNKLKIQQNHGYSEISARSLKAIKTKTYQRITKPYADRLKKHQEKVLRAMEQKDLKEEEYKVLADSLSKITHDVQLLTGGATANIATKLEVSFIDGNSQNGNTKGV